MDHEKILKEIDEMHQFSYLALEQKRLEDYINLFSDTLTYQQLNGKIIDKKQLAKDQAFYFSRLKEAKSQYERTNFSVEGNRFTENIIQKASISFQVFFIFTKKWTIERVARYEWIKNGGHWKIEKVEILQEKIYR